MTLRALYGAQDIHTRHEGIHGRGFCIAWRALAWGIGCIHCPDDGWYCTSGGIASTAFSVASWLFTSSIDQLAISPGDFSYPEFAKNIHVRGLNGRECFRKGCMCPDDATKRIRVYVIYLPI